MAFIQEKIEDVNLQRIQRTLANHSRIEYLGEINFHGDRAYLYTSFCDDEQRVIVVDKDNRFFISTGKDDPRYYLEITSVLN